MRRECCTHGGENYKSLVKIPDVNRPIGRPRRRWEDNIKLYLKEVE
jgi:hypothetical protein